MYVFNGEFLALVVGMDNFAFTIALYYWEKIRNNPFKYEGGKGRLKIYEDNNSDEMSLVEIWLLQVRHPEELQSSIRMHKCRSEQNFL